MKFIKKPKDGACRDIHGRLVPGGYTARYNVGDKNVNQLWRNWLFKELSALPNGMDGMVKVDNGYTNRLDSHK